MSEPPFAPHTPLPPDAPLAYASPPPARPGLITAIGICSIVIGSLGVLSSLCGSVQGVMYLVASSVTQTSTMTYTTSVSVNGSPTTAATTTFSVPPGTRSPFMPFHVSPLASGLSVIGEALSLCVAIYLIVAGAAVLRDKLSAQRMHWRYVFIKIPIVLIAAVGTWAMSRDVMENVAAMQTGGAPTFSAAGATWIALVQAGFSAAFSLLYPIALIVALNTRPVKAYFDGGQLRYQ